MIMKIRLWQTLTLKDVKISAILSNLNNGLYFLCFWMI